MSDSALARTTAIATLWDGGERFECGLLLWCRSAVRLAHAIGAPEQPLIISRANQSVDCPKGRFIWPKRTAAAVKAYTATTPAGRASLNLLKVALFGLLEFSLILFADLDVDVAPPPIGLGWPAPPGWIERWHAGARQFWRSGAVLVGSPDHSSMLNGGVLLMKPMASVHISALRALSHNLSFSASDGFNQIGRPQSLWHLLDISMLSLGTCMTPSQVCVCVHV